MPRIELTVDEADLHRLTLEAKALGVHRSALIRERALSSSGVKSLNREQHQKCVQTVARCVPGLPRTQIEALVAIAISALHKAEH